MKRFINQISTTTNIGGRYLKSCVYNASGPRCTSYKELDKILHSHSGAIVSKSCTMKSRKGNPHPRYWDNDLLSINSTGLENKGYKYYINYFKDKDENNNAFNFFEPRTIKPYFISVSGLSDLDNLTIIEDIYSTSINNTKNNISGIELNLSCPNVIGKPQIGYDFDATNNLLNDIAESIQTCKNYQTITFGLKLPPYFDLEHFYIMADIIKQYNFISYITCVNSLGNGLVVNPESESAVIKPKHGLGGIGGKVIKSIALSNVFNFYQLFKEHNRKSNHTISVIGCGGIETGRDAFEHILCGAQAVQVGTQFYKEGVPCFERIDRELKEIMAKKGYNRLFDFRGTLKEL